MRLFAYREAKNRLLWLFSVDVVVDHRGNARIGPDV